MTLGFTAVPCKHCHQPDCFRPDPTPHSLIGNRFLLQKCLGNGAHGSVWTASDTSKFTSELVAIKIPACKTSPNDVNVLSYLRDALEKVAANHKGFMNVLIPIGAISRMDGRLCVVLPIMTGALHKINLSSGGLEEVFGQLALGLDWLHRCAGVLHGDIKSDNVLYTRSESTGKITVKFSDFSCAKRLRPRDSVPIDKVVQAIICRSPEVLVKNLADPNNHPVSFPIDVWALGMMFGELWNRGRKLVDPYGRGGRDYNEDLHRRLVNSLEGKVAGMLEKRGDGRYVGVLRKVVPGMLRCNPGKRWTSKDVLVGLGITPP